MNNMYHLSKTHGMELLCRYDNDGNVEKVAVRFYRLHDGKKTTYRPVFAEFFDKEAIEYLIAALTEKGRKDSSN